LISPFPANWQLTTGNDQLGVFAQLGC